MSDLGLLLLALLVLLLLWRGPKVLPGLGESLGQAVRGIRRGVRDAEEKLDAPERDPEEPRA
ncbi:MAG TPA: twin-arginine translocase TatA/TatE family subunit [Candidatus Limnocylindrales bacterium]|nr:twin-arginine translocase TatA/TatE family subunit [Candidatus Limnocylindrales bacterium]